MAKTVKEMAMSYYPKLWNIERIKALVEAGKLTSEEYEEITGEAYPDDRETVE